jgi:hypothetical protein
MKNLIIAAIAAAMLLAAVSCGGSGGSGGSRRSGGPASYLTVSNSTVAFIQWRATSNGHLHGTISESNVGGSAPAEILSVSSAPFIGTTSGGSVTLTFAVLYFLHTSTHGTLSGSTLTLRVPQSDGTVQQAKFSQSDEASYNRAIATLRSTIRHANLLAARQQARQPEQSAKAQAEQGIQSALSALYKDSSLAFSGMLARGLARFADDIQTARSDLATEEQDASASKSYCVAAFKVAGDAQSVEGDLKSVQGDVQSMMPDILTVRNDGATANAHLRGLSKVGLPAPSSASNVIASAKANLRQAIAKANSYIDQINAIDAQARSIADNMATRSCSGARSGSSTPYVSHIK